MKKSFRKRLKNRGREKGIALLFTLGILGLLTVLALSFAASSMLERKAAQYNAGASASRIMANAGLNRAMAAMTLYKSLSYENFDQLVSHSPSTSPIDSLNYQTFDQLYKMNTMVEGMATFFDIENYDKTSDNAMHWIYVYNGKSDPNNEIIGRFAYIVTPAGGRLDPAVSVTTMKEEAKSRDVGDAANYVPRVGAKPDEIYIGDLEPNLNKYLSLTDVQNLSYTNAGGLYNGTSWSSYGQLFGDLGVTDVMKMLKWQWDWFAVGSDAASYNELYWEDANHNKQKDTGEEFHRFNLARTDWDTLTISNLTTAPTSGAYSTSAGLKWFKNSKLEKGTFSSSAERTNQVAANLLDYCDSNDNPTTDKPDFANDTPTYTGNEKTPYINEFSIKVVPTVSITALGDTDSDSIPEFTCSLAVTITVAGEIVNVFDSGLLNASEMHIKPKSGTGDIQITVTWIDENGSGIPPQTIAPLQFPNAANRYNKNDPTAVYTYTHTGNIEQMACPSIQITSVEIPAFDIYLTYNGSNCDYAKVQTTNITLTGAASAPLAARSAPGIDPNPAVSYIYDWEAIDPRQNLNYGDWQFSTPAATTIEAENTTASTASGSGDAEAIAASGRFVSTAYIRNAPMRSPWELGAIHRGVKWETINLKDYELNSDGDPKIFDNPASVADCYNAGDGVLLDEIKMTEDTATKGLINIKSAKELIVSNNEAENLAVFRALVNGIPISTDYANVDSNTPAGTIISATSPGTITESVPLSNANTIARQIKTYMENNFCKNRGEIVNATGLCNGSTDAEKEAIVGKFVTLTTLAPSSMFKVVVLAQTLKDVGGPSGGSSTTDATLTKGDLNSDSSISASAITSPSSAVKEAMGFAWYSRYVNAYRYFPDANFTSGVIYEKRSCRKGRYEVGFDKVTGEQKIVVILKYNDVTRIWSVLSYEVVSE